MSKRAGLVASLVFSFALATTATAQIAQPAAAPVPGQILAARRMFISNAGSQSYGGETYYRLTKYDGGPDRLYNQFYAAMKDWGRYELADGPANADIVAEVRFADPIVDHVVSPVGDDSRSESVHDPQLNLTILDPASRVPLWSLTEHIQPGNSREADNKYFDEAVGRLVQSARSLGSSAYVFRAAANVPPPGAAQAAKSLARANHTAVGAAIGGAVGAVIISQAGRCNGPVDCTSAKTRASVTRGLTLGFGSLVLGAFVGWLWPTGF